MRKVYRVIMGLFGALVLALALGLSLWIGGNAGRKEWVKATETSDVKSGTDADDPLGCKKMRDKWGRPLVLQQSPVGGYYFCARLPKPDEEAERRPMWVLRGVKLWKDDYTPCPLPIEAARCDQIGDRDIHERPFCAFGPKGETMRHYVEVVVDDSNTGEFVLMGYGDGPAIVGFELFSTFASESLNIRGITAERREAIYLDDVRAQDFVTVWCTPQGDVSFELVDESGEPLEAQWAVHPVNYMEARDCPGEQYGHRLCKVFADRDIRVRFAIRGRAPLYATVRARKGQVTKEEVVVAEKKSSGSVVGCVRDAATGKPIPNVRVSIYPKLPADVPHFSAVTDEKGCYKLAGIGAGWVFDVAPIMELPQDPFAWRRLVYKNKTVGKGQVLRLDFDMVRGDFRNTIVLDPDIEFLGEEHGCMSERTLNTIIDGASHYIDAHFNMGYSALGNCFGLDHPFVAKLRNYYYGGPSPKAQKICVKETLEGDGVARVNNSLDHGWNGVIELSALPLMQLIDPEVPKVELYAWFLHELVHVASPLNGDDPDELRQWEVDACACQSVCTAERDLPYDGTYRYPCAVPSPELWGYCLSEKSWDELIRQGLVFGLDWCPTPSGAIPRQTCQPHLDPVTGSVTPQCEECCPPGGVQQSPNCNPNMKCWMDFAPKSRPRKDELAEVNRKVWNFVGLLGPQCGAARLCEIGACKCKNTCAWHRCQGSTTHSLELHGDRPTVSSAPLRVSSISLQAGRFLQHQSGWTLDKSHDARIRSLGSILRGIKFFLPEMRVRALQWLRKQTGGASCVESSETR